MRLGERIWDYVRGKDIERNFEIKLRLGREDREDIVGEYSSHKLSRFLGNIGLVGILASYPIYLFSSNEVALKGFLASALVTGIFKAYDSLFSYLDREFARIRDLYED